ERRRPDDGLTRPADIAPAHVPPLRLQARQIEQPALERLRSCNCRRDGDGKSCTIGLGQREVELIGAYSNRPAPLILSQLRSSEPRKPRIPSTPRQVRRRLNPEQITQLCVDYQAGSTTRQLADTYGVGKTAITRLLREQGIPLRHQGLSPDQRVQAIQLYQTGKSVAAVATALGFHPSSVYDALVKADVEMRDAHARGR
ncbi:MAG: hypothetical protein JWN04_4662, partial [Myxococcaceae bacterium]|nr:hypothetical protein [Myxococcaceae bacterium]